MSNHLGFVSNALGNIKARLQSGKYSNVSNTFTRVIERPSAHTWSKPRLFGEPNRHFDHVIRSRLYDM